MPWFPDFVAAGELVRREAYAAGHADPVGQYLRALMAGEAHELEAAWPGRVTVLDPYAGKVHGPRQLRQFFHDAEAFLASHLVDVAPVASTSAANRAAVELLAHLRVDGEAVTWPVAVVAASDDVQSITLRTYASQWPVVGRRPVRPPILQDDATTTPDDVVGRHLAALAAGDREALVGTFTTDGWIREPIGADPLHRGHGEIDAFFAGRLDAGGGIQLDPCCTTDDGTRCAVEFNCSRWGRRPVPAQAGLVVFERAPGGLLAAARYYDDLTRP